MRKLTVLASFLFLVDYSEAELFEKEVLEVSSFERLKNFARDTFDLATRVKRNDFTNNYGYGPFGIGPTNGGFDSYGFYRDKFYNSGLPPLYSFASYRNYYHEISFHKNKYGQPAPTDFEVLQQERFGPYYDGVWGYADHSKNWFGKR